MNSANGCTENHDSCSSGRFYTPIRLLICFGSTPIRCTAHSCLISRPASVTPVLPPDSGPLSGQLDAVELNGSAPLGYEKHQSCQFPQNLPAAPAHHDNLSIHIPVPPKIYWGNTTPQYLGWGQPASHRNPRCPPFLPATRNFPLGYRELL